MTYGGVPMKPNAMTFASGEALASNSACRKVPGPESARLLTVIVCGMTWITNEHWLALPAASAAVHKTGVEPTENTDPGAGTHETRGVASQSSVAPGTVYATLAVPEPGALSGMNASSGHWII